MNKEFYLKMHASTPSLLYPEATHYCNNKHDHTHDETMLLLNVHTWLFDCNYTLNSVFSNC